MADGTKRRERERERDGEQRERKKDAKRQPPDKLNPAELKRKALISQHLIRTD